MKWEFNTINNWKPMRLTREAYFHAGMGLKVPASV
jgi:hypothetical protein